MKPFFVPEDFLHWVYEELPTAKQVADIANSRLQQECVRVYGRRLAGDEFFTWFAQPGVADTHQSYLLPPEPIEACKHEASKVRENPGKLCQDYECECGARVKPNSFVKVDE